jgi:iron complex transport system ATP-binding protein
LAAILQIEHLTAGYGRKPILRDIHLEIEAGEVCALIGRNGSGKTTLMRCINAVLKPIRGCVRVNGQPVDQLNRPRIARLIGMVPQNGHTAWPFSCLEMILMGAAARLRPWASPGPAEQARAERIGAELGISALLPRSFQQLSGGERQLILLARALFQDVTIMLLDEPNTHLDFANQHTVMGLMRRIVKHKGITALVTLHDPNLALQYCDTAIMLSQGTIAARGAVEEMINDQSLRRVLGDNIQCDRTRKGFRVVIPRYMHDDADGG